MGIVVLRLISLIVKVIMCKMMPGDETAILQAGKTVIKKETLI